MRGEGSRVGARVSRQSEDRAWTLRRPLSSAVSNVFDQSAGETRVDAYQLNATIPRACGEGILCDQVP